MQIGLNLQNILAAYEQGLLDQVELGLLKCMYFATPKMADEFAARLIETKQRRLRLDALKSGR